MSHYTCLVVGDGYIEEQMAPFMENCCGEPDKRFMEFYDIEDEYRKRYEEDGVEKVVMPDGKLLLPWDNKFKVPFKKGDISTLGKYKVPKNLEKRMVPYKETYPTFEEYMKDYCGYASRNDIYNRYGYFQNPNAKWDWYEIGGRWTGFFQLKKGKKGKRGKQYNFTGELFISGNKADRCFKADIDFEAMRKDLERSAANRYDLVQKAIKDTPVNKSWDEVRDSVEDSVKDIEKARNKYHDQPRVKAFKELVRSETGLFGFLSTVEEYSIPRDQYLDQSRNHAGVTHAILKDGKWYESGEMGWWGVVNNEKDPETWDAMYNKMVDELPDSTILTLVDCHT